jgi:hypothetical protein
MRYDVDDQLPKTKRDRITAPKDAASARWQAELKELYPRMAGLFPQLTEEDLAARLPSSPSTFR